MRTRYRPALVSRGATDTGLKAAVVTAGLGLALATSACIAKGPIPELAHENLSLTYPSSLEAWETQPYGGWESAETADGKPALIQDGPRGIDNTTAWVTSGWRIAPAAATDAESACPIFVELIRANNEDEPPGKQERETVNSCVKALSHSGNLVGQTWPVSMADGLTARARANMQWRRGSGQFWVSVTMTEERAAQE